jgi:S-adenosylmethionine-diacylgycerolhomoserine-N-methlytransferase
MRAAPSPEAHAGLMDRVYRRQRYIYDFTRKYYLFGRDRLIAGLALGPGSNLVEVGCGTARNLIAIARRYPGARLFGLDASQAMLETAARSVERAGLATRITLRLGYAEHLTPGLFGERQPFDCAIFSYSLSMIPDWKKALNAASQGLSPGGQIHIVDFGDLAGLGVLPRSLLLKWLALFHVAPRVELLQSFESQQESSLRVLPMRYAFVLTTGKRHF